jgi:hypothetical protein
MIFARILADTDDQTAHTTGDELRSRSARWAPVAWWRVVPAEPRYDHHWIDRPEAAGLACVTCGVNYLTVVTPQGPGRSVTGTAHAHCTPSA